MRIYHIHKQIYNMTICSIASKYIINKIGMIAKTVEIKVLSIVCK